MINVPNIPLKIRTYGNSYMFHMQSQKLVQNRQLLKHPKVQTFQSYFSKYWRVKRQNMLGILIQKISLFQFNIIINIHNKFHLFTSNDKVLRDGVIYLSRKALVIMHVHNEPLTHIGRAVWCWRYHPSGSYQSKILLFGSVIWAEIISFYLYLLPGGTYTIIYGGRRPCMYSYYACRGYIPPPSVRGPR